MRPRYVIYQELVKSGVDPEAAFTKAYEGCSEDTKRDARAALGLPQTGETCSNCGWSDPPNQWGACWCERHRDHRGPQEHCSGWERVARP